MSERFGPYLLLRPLGAGAQAEVHLARDERLGRDVALKLLPEAATAEALRRFEREGRALARLDHPAICKVYDVGVHEGRPYLAMKPVEGTSLDERLAAARTNVAASIDAKSTATLFAALARGLEAVHAAGLVHRDVKPANILIDDAGRPILVDFGIAHDADGGETLTRTGQSPGTPAWMAPEQILGGEIDGRTDVFALGVALYESLTLEHPFPGDTRAERWKSILDAEPPRPAPTRDRIRDDLLAAAFKALEKEPARRYPSAAAMADDLEAAAEGRPLVARSPGILSPLLRRARRHPVGAAGSILVVLLLLVLAALGIFRILAADDVAIGEAEAERRSREALLEEAFLELGEGTPAQAGLLFDRLLAESDVAPIVVAGRAIAALAEGRTEVAAATLERLPRVLRERPSARRLLASASRGDGEVADSSSAAAPADAFDAIVDGLEDLRRGHGGDEAAFARAVDHFRTAILLLPAAPAYVHAEYAHALYHVHDGAAGARAADFLERHFGDRSSVLFRAGMARLATDSAHAARVLERACTLAPNVAAIRINTGIVLSEAGRLAEGWRHLEHALRIAPNDARAHYNAAAALVRLGQRDESVEHAARSIALDPAMLVDVRDLAYRSEVDDQNTRTAHDLYLACAKAETDLARQMLDRSEAARLEGDDVGRRDFLEEAESLHAERIDVILARARLLADEGRFHEACERTDRLVVFRPRDGVIQELHRDVNEALGRLDVAISAGARVLLLRPGSRPDAFRLGLLLQRTRRFEEAVAVFDEALSHGEVAEFLCNRSFALAECGRLAEALASVERGHAIGIKRDRWPWESARWIEEARARLDDARARLADANEDDWTVSEAYELVPFAESEGALLLAARRFAEADEDARDDPPALVLIAAARAAARAAAGEGPGAANLGDSERATLRRNAIAWFERALEAHLAEPNPGLLWLLESWRDGPSIAPLRKLDGIADRIDAACREVRISW